MDNDQMDKERAERAFLLNRISYMEGLVLSMHSMLHSEMWRINKEMGQVKDRFELVERGVQNITTGTELYKKVKMVYDNHNSGGKSFLDSDFLPRLQWLEGEVAGIKVKVLGRDGDCTLGQGMKEIEK